MLGKNHDRIHVVGVIAVIPDVVEDVFNIGIDAPVALSVPDAYVRLVKSLDCLKDNARVRPVTSVVILPGPGHGAKHLAAASLENTGQNGESGPFGGPWNGVALASNRTAREDLASAAKRLNIVRFGVEP